MSVSIKIRDILIEAEDLETALEIVNDSNLNKFEAKETLNKKGYEVEVCEECGKLYPREDGEEVFGGGTGGDLGFVCNRCSSKEGYTICHGCGPNTWGCFMRKEDLHTVLETDDSGSYVEGKTCDDFIENYPYHCESCDFYFADSFCEEEDEEKGCCPICGEKAD